MKCKYHPRSDSVGVCSVCGIPLCKRCIIYDRGAAYCDGCYASEEGEDGADAVHAEELAESDDYIDIELMDLLDTDDDEGLF
jgi:hypothetical protein